ncbi:hepatic triacylglycerol lipase-like isoform X2 [Myxocyprinus asiaticus]|uniref:hepatic triacylglycerol lipase-like isoform X2 n=1 Tax=Myxocyprinus asiaticus TaxID=70543 RepID=UPI002221CD00|nr:hepatic triacylglycerol lipase-like isoform X2 [Myxocyprinus asiaticus]
MLIYSRVVTCLCLIYTLTSAVEEKTNFTDAAVETHISNHVKTPLLVKSSFHVYHEGNVFEETCTVVPFRSETLDRCSYNRSDPLVLIIHGWTMNGIMEQWIFRLASALKIRIGQVNVLISDWRNLALQPYPIAAKNSRQVGQDVAVLLKWLEEAVQLSMDKVHLIGYSLGAHVAGLAGSHFRGSRKVGRITGVPKTIKCPHERAVKLFTDSLLNTSQPIIGYRCRDESTFNKGLCLDCKQKRCNMLGYDIRHVRVGKKAKGLYMKTGPDTPYKVFHYQLRVLLLNVIEPVEASVTVSLNGTTGESTDLTTVLYQESSGEKSFTSLITVDTDVGHLTSIRLVWRGELVWSSWLRRVRNIMSWTGPYQVPELSVWRIRIKSGETQEKMWFCGVSDEVTNLKPSEEKEFRRCETLKRKKQKSKTLHTRSFTTDDTN